MLPEPLLGRRPEDEELARKKAELSRLQVLLVDGELSLTSLRTELAAVERLYLATVGKRYAELDEIEAKIAEHVAHAYPGDAQVQDAANQARSQASASSSALGDSQAAESGEAVAFQSPTLKSLYRDVAKGIHPDLATDSADRLRREQLMREANTAYEQGDEDRLKAILVEYESSPESVKGEGPGAELVRVIRKIAQVNRRLAEIDGEVATLRESEQFQLKAKVDQAAIEGRNLLQEMAEALDAQIAASQERLECLSER